MFGARSKCIDLEWQCFKIISARHAWTSLNIESFEKYWNAGSDKMLHRIQWNESRFDNFKGRPIYQYNIIWVKPYIIWTCLDKMSMTIRPMPGLKVFDIVTVFNCKIIITNVIAALFQQIPLVLPPWFGLKVNSPFCISAVDFFWKLESSRKFFLQNWSPLGLESWTKQANIIAYHWWALKSSLYI